MFRFTARELVLLTLFALSTLMASLFMFVDGEFRSLAALPLLLGVIGLIAVDARRRQRQHAKALARMHRDMASWVKEVRQQVKRTHRLGEDLAELLPTSAWLARQEENVKRAIAAAERVGLAVADSDQRREVDLTDLRQRLLGRSTDQLESLSTLRQDVLQAIGNVQADGRRMAGWDMQQVEALIQLYARVSPAKLMPLSGRWAMEPVGLFALVDMLEREEPQLIVELGSGTSTVWLAHTLERLGQGRLVSVEHDDRFAKRTTGWLREQGLNRSTEVRHAPLVDLEVGGSRQPWYDVRALDDLENIQFLIIDGPPSTVAHNARFPAFPAIEGKLADQATIVLDDAQRPDEKRIVAQWLNDCAVLTHDKVASSVGRHAVLRYSRTR